MFFHANMKRLPFRSLISYHKYMDNISNIHFTHETVLIIMDGRANENNYFYSRVLKQNRQR